MQENSQEKNTAKQPSFPMYKGHPLVRSGDTLYLGSMREDYVVKIDIKTKKKVANAEVPDKVTIQLLSTNPENSVKKAILKASEKNGLYLALDLADVWLKRSISN